MQPPSPEIPTLIPKPPLLSLAGTILHSPISLLLLLHPRRLRDASQAPDDGPHLLCLSFLFVRNPLGTLSPRPSRHADYYPRPSLQRRRPLLLLLAPLYSRDAREHELRQPGLRHRRPTQLGLLDLTRKEEVHRTCVGVLRGWIDRMEWQGGFLRRPACLVCVA